MKKTLSIIISLMMLLSSFSCITAFATDSDNTISDLTNESVAVFKTYLEENELSFNENYFFLANLPELNDDVTTTPTSFVLKIETTASTELELALGFINVTNGKYMGIPSANKDNGLDANYVVNEAKVSSSDAAEVLVIADYSLFTSNYIGVSVMNGTAVNDENFSITMTPISATADFKDINNNDFSLVITTGNAIAASTVKSFEGPVSFSDSSLAKMGAVLTSLKFGTTVSYDDVVAALSAVNGDDATSELETKLDDDIKATLAEIIANGNSGKTITTNSGVVTLPYVALAKTPADGGSVYAVEAEKVEATEAKPTEKDDVVAYNITIKADGEEVTSPVVKQKVIIDLPNGWSSEGVWYKHEGAIEWAKDAVVEDGKIVFYADSFSTYTLAGTNVEAAEDTRADEVKFEIVQDEVNKNKFSLLITPTDDEKQIIKFVAAAMKYDFRIGNHGDEAMQTFTYKITEADGISIKMIDENAKYTSDSVNGFSFIATASNEDHTLTVGVGESIKVADLEIIGNGKIDVSTESFETDDLAYFETADDNEIDSVKVFSTTGFPTTIEIPKQKYDLTINVDFGLNRVETTDADYLGMTVTLVGSISKEETVLNIGDEIAVTLDEANKKASATGTVNLDGNESYTFVIEGLGYRTYRGSVYLDGNKTINLWNNAKTSGSVNVIADDDTTAKDVTFLVGDIYMDGIVDIYDLSAATSYYGAENIDKANTNVYACDLNRDGKITIADIAYVQVSYGN